MCTPLKTGDNSHIRNSTSVPHELRKLCGHTLSTPNRSCVGLRQSFCLCRFWLETRSAYSLASCAPGPTPACREPRQVPNTPPCQPVGAAWLPLAPALATRAPEAGCQVWGWGRAFRRAGGLLGRRTISYGPNDQVDRVVAPAAAGNNRWLQSPKSVEVTCGLRARYAPSISYKL